MANIDEIMKRIKDRNNLMSNSEEIVEQKEKKEHHFGLNFSIFLLTLFSLVLGVLIYAKKDENGNFLKENFDIEVNFSEINEIAKGFIDKFFVFEYNFDKSKSDQYVGLSDSYIGLGNNEYTNSAYKVYAIDDGVVTNVTSNSIRIEHDNGVITDYVNIVDSNVFKFDRVKEYQIIANMDEKIEMYFYQDGVIINYEEIYS